MTGYTNYAVTITECGPGREFIVNVRVPHDAVRERDGRPVTAAEAAVLARQRAIRSRFGSSAVWVPDNSLAGYGQVGRSVETGVSTITARSRWDASPQRPFPVDVEGQRRHDEMMDDMHSQEDAAFYESFDDEAEPAQ
jgi:hypothetical protein